MMHKGRDFDAGEDIGYDYRRKIGRFVREQRLRLGMTQAELGEHLGMGNTAVSALELGRSVVAPERFSTMADLFGVPRAEMGKFLLRYTNPWIYALIYGERSNDLKSDLQNLSPPTKD
jgi:transcriptional regulator with XRE-family HTH domain